MMDQTFSAIFEDGVFRPVEPVDFPEHCQLRVEVRSVEPPYDGASRDEAHAILPIADEVSLSPDDSPFFSAIPRALSERFDLDELLGEPSGKQGVSAILGQWPGDESDEQIATALKELS